MRNVLSSVPFVFAALGLVSGCGNKNNKGANEPMTCPPGQYFDGQFCRDSAPPPLPTDTSTNTSSDTTSEGSAPSPAEQLPQLVAAHVASGATPLGDPITGNIAPGQNLEANVQMDPGRCFSAVAAAGPNVQDLEATFELVSPIPGSSPILAIDKNEGPTAVVAPQPNCYKWALPMGAPVKVVVKSKAGAGPAAVQVFVK